MRSVEVLGREHELVKALIRALETLVTRARQGADLPPQLLSGLLTHLAYHIESVHMAKEEHVLFPYLETRGLPRKSPVVAALAAQHETVRVFGQDLRALCERLTAGDPAAPAAFATLATEFIALCREHMRIEDEYFYSLAGQSVPPQDDQTLLARFEAIDRITDVASHREASERFLEQFHARLAART